MAGDVERERKVAERQGGGYRPPVTREPRGGPVPPHRPV